MWGPHTVCHADPIHILYLNDQMWLVGSVITVYHNGIQLFCDTILPIHLNG